MKNKKEKKERKVYHLKYSRNIFLIEKSRTGLSPKYILLLK